MKNKGWQNFGGQIRCIKGDVQVAYSICVVNKSLSDLLPIKMLSFLPQTYFDKIQ